MPSDATGFKSKTRSAGAAARIYVRGVTARRRKDGSAMMSEETKAEEIASTVVRDPPYRAVLAGERKRVLLAREAAS